MSRAVIRKLVTVTDEIHREMGQDIDPPTCRAAAIAVIENPFAGRFVADLGDLMEIGAELGDLLGDRAVAALWVYCRLRSRVTARRPWSAPMANWNMPPPFCIRNWARRCGRRSRTGRRWCRLRRSVAGPARPSTYRSVTRMRPMSAAISTAWKFGSMMRRGRMKSLSLSPLPTRAARCRASAAWKRRTRSAKTVFDKS